MFIGYNSYSKIFEDVMLDLEKLYNSVNIGYYFNDIPYITERLFTALRNWSIDQRTVYKTIKLQILETAHKCEKEGALSCDLFIGYLLYLYHTYRDYKIIKQVQSELEIYYYEFKEELELNRNKNKITLEDINNIILYSSNNKIIANMVIDAIYLSGLEGTIFTETTLSEKSSVELRIGYNFPIGTYKELLSNSWDRNNVKVLIIDGIVERESEIFKIFSDLYKSKESLLLIARGYGEEVISIIARNSHVMDVCPVRIPFDVNSLNTIADLAVCTNGKLVSALNGDLVSMVKYSELSSIDHVICSKNKLFIHDKSTKLSVKCHLSDLIKRRNEEQGKEEIYDKRIRNLTSHSVYIRLSNKTEQENIRESETLDYALRVANNAINTGIYKGKEKAWFRSGLRTNQALLSSVYYGNSLYMILRNIGGVITQQQN